jgi:hypothetical protein
MLKPNKKLGYTLPGRRYQVAKDFDLERHGKYRYLKKTIYIKNKFR